MCLFDVLNSTYENPVFFKNRNFLVSDLKKYVKIELELHKRCLSLQIYL